MAKQRLLEHCKVSPSQNYYSSSSSSSPTNLSLPLTFFDIPWLLFPPRNPLFFFEYGQPTSHFLSSTLPNIKHSLSLTLQHFLPFSGTLTIPSPPDKPHIQFNHDSDNHVPMIIMETNADFNHLSGSYPREASELHPFVPELGPITSGKHLLGIQVTVFPMFGLAIGFSYHHVLGDERTFNNFLKTWALLCRDSSSSIEISPSYERKMIKDNQGLQSIFLKDYRKRISAQKDKVSLSSLVRATFLVTPSAMERIKSLILDQCKRNNYISKTMHLSPYVLTCAFVWVCLIKSKNYDGLDWDDSNYFGFIAGGLTRFDTPVPQSYVGNCVGFGRATAMTKEMLGENGIVAAAKAIGNAIKILDEEFLRGAENWMSDWEVLIGSDLHMTVTGSPKVNLYETDFGWGFPKKIEEISIDKIRGISLTESRHLKGGIEVGLALPSDEMETFSSFFDRGLNLLQ
ncbi:hypothetical protein ACFE04_000366 [Oxalis oulophora]